MWLVFVLAVSATLGWGEEAPARPVEAASQEKGVQLLQKVIQDHWEGGDAKGYGGTNGLGGYTNVVQAFRAVSELMPWRLDLRFGLASALLGEALQTNGPPLELKIKEALSVYQEIRRLDTNGFDAPILYAAYTRAIGDTKGSATVIKDLLASHSGRTIDYLNRFDLIDWILKTEPAEKPEWTMPKDEHHAIVILGAGLETNGTMKPKLVSRLELGLKLARFYRHAPVIVTGGNPKSGVTEAYVMANWLKQKGISKKRVQIEDKARDTVENAVYCSAILQRLAVTHVTLVTSFSHVRRASADLQEACSQRGLRVEYEAVGVKSKGDSDLKPDQERVGIYRDVMRTSGLWAFPGLLR